MYTTLIFRSLVQAKYQNIPLNLIDRCPFEWVSWWVGNINKLFNSHKYPFIRVLAIKQVLT